jgi:hypothetical protein
MGCHRRGAAISTAASKAKTFQRSRRQRGFERELRSTWFPPTRNFLKLYLSFLRRDLHDRPAVGLVVLAADPEPVQQYRQFPGDGHHRSFLAAFSSALG